METRKRALGKGLEQLFNSEAIDVNELEKQIYETTPKEEIVELDINELRPNPYQDVYKRQISDSLCYRYE